MDPELWSAAQVADHLGLADAHSARHILSRWGVRAVRYEPGKNGRPEARYDAQAVREAKAARPGRGARTDRRQNAS